MFTVVGILFMLVTLRGALSPGERKLRGQLAAHTSWSRTSDRSARTKSARDKFGERFLDEVDPERKLPEAERARRAQSARKAYYTGLALKSAKARRRRGSSA